MGRVLRGPRGASGYDLARCQGGSGFRVVLFLVTSLEMSGWLFLGEY